MISIFYSFTKH